MKKLTKSLVALALLTGIIFTGVQVVQAAGVAEKPSLLISHQAFCTSNGGTWTGINALRGECLYPPGSAGHKLVGICLGDQNTIVSYLGVAYVPDQQGGRFSRNVRKPSQGLAFTTRCVNISSSGYGKCGDEVAGTEDEAVISTCSGVTVTFEAGACTGKCTVSRNVLNPAAKGLSKLDGDVIGQAYVKVRNPGGGSYKICFPGEGTIYRWVSGTWVAQPTQTVNGESCAWSSGDGNYVLVAAE